MKNKLVNGVLTLILSFVIFFVGLNSRIVGDPNEVYQVYLEGEKIGLIKSKNELYDLIDTEQSAIKNQYGVDKVYPPNGLDVKKIYTYDNELTKTNDLYDKIKDIEPFTIQGYTVTITYTDDVIADEEITVHKGEVRKIYLLNKDIITKSLHDTAAVFIGEEDLKKYDEGIVTEITDTGESLTSVYFAETITIKEDLISTEEYIFKDSDELSRYLLYGTLKEQKQYVVKSGDDLETIAENNNLNILELMIANPDIPNSNILLTEGDVINVGLINPLLSVTYHKKVVSDQEIAYKTEYVEDKTRYQDYKKVTTKGVNGVNRLYQDVTYVNGEIRALKIDSSETIKEMVPEVVTRGTKSYGGGSYTYVDVGGTSDYSWPTVSPFVISSRYKWRWGKQHKGIDISGCGTGSPIFAVKEGTVVDQGYHSSMGNYVVIDHGNGVYTQYMHMLKTIVTKGTVVKRQQKIGYMGSTGYSTGTHLHLGVWYGGMPYKGGTVVDPCKSIFKC